MSTAPQVGEDGAECPPPYNTLVDTANNPNHYERQENPPPYFHLENVFDAPPDYYSIFVNRLDSDGRHGVHWMCLRKTAHIVLSTVGFSVLLLVFMSVPIAMLVIGAIFVGKCPAQPNIPVFLVVAGLLGILKNVFLISERLATKRLTLRPPLGARRIRAAHCGWRLFNITFNLFMLSWIICGSYWVYHIYRKISADRFVHCNEVVYKLGFGAITSSYIILVLVVTCVCCCGLCLKRNVPEPDPELDLIQDHDEREEVEEEEVEREEEVEGEGGDTAISEVEGGNGTTQSENYEPGVELSDITQQEGMPAPLSAAPSSPVQTSYLSTVV